MEEKSRAVDAAAESEYVAHFWRDMPERYIYANEAREIEAHARFALAADGERARVGILATDEPYVELAFVGDDRPGLLAIITATLAAARLPLPGPPIHSFYARDRRGAAPPFFSVETRRHPAARPHPY